MVVPRADAHQLAGVEALLHRRAGRGLDADDLDPRAQRLDRDRDAGDEPAASDRHQHRLQVGLLLEQLERDRALARDHRLVVERMDGDQAALLLDLERVGVGLVEIVAEENDLGAVLARVRNLDQRRSPRHDDGRRDALARRVVGDRLRVVARGGGDDAALARRGRELQDLVEGAALLEGAGHLQVLELEAGARPAVPRHRLGAGAGGEVDAAADALARLLDVPQLGHEPRMVAAARRRAARRSTRRSVGTIGLNQMKAHFTTVKRAVDPELEAAREREL